MDDGELVCEGIEHGVENSNAQTGQPNTHSMFLADHLIMSIYQVIND